MAPPSSCTSPLRSARVAETLAAALVLTTGAWADQEGRDQSRCVVVVQATQQGTVGIFEDQVDEAVVATIGVPEITLEEGLTVKPSGNPKAANRMANPGYHVISVCVLGESLVGQTAGKHGGPGAVPKVQKLLEAVFWLSKVAFTQSADRAFACRISSKEALTAEVREKGISDRRSRRIGKESTCFVEHTVYISFDSSGWSVDYARDGPLTERSCIGCRQDASQQR